MGRAKHDAAVTMLNDGCSGEEVMAFLRKECGTEASLSCAISRVRGKVIANLSPPPNLGEALAFYRLAWC